MTRRRTIKYAAQGITKSNDEIAKKPRFAKAKGETLADFPFI
jgi:hypothetical protein